MSIIKRITQHLKKPETVAVLLNKNNSGHPVATFIGRHHVEFRKNNNGEWLLVNTELTRSLDMFAGRHG